MYTMNTTTTTRKYRVAFEVSGTKATRLRVKERDGRGNYIDLGRPWRQEDVMAIQTVRRMINLLARGISDVDDIIATVNKTGPSRRRGMKKPPSGQGLFAEDTSAVKVRPH
jgi:hypothetical protein